MHNTHRKQFTPRGCRVQNGMMKVALLKISASRVSNHLYTYNSMIMEMGASPKWTNTFESEEEMVRFMNRILSKQKAHCDVRLALEKIRKEGLYLYDLSLLPEEARALGWRPAAFPKPPSHDASRS